MKQKLLKIASLLLGLISAFNLVSSIAAYIIAHVLGGISFSVNRAFTIGVIGGADGPTAVFVTASPGTGWEWLLWLTLLAVSIFTYRRVRKTK